MDVKIYVDAEGEETFRSYRLTQSGDGQRHKFEGKKGPGRVYSAPEGSLLLPDKPGGDIVLRKPDGNCMTAEQCWNDGMPADDSL